MSVSFDLLKIGKQYDRPYLAKLWGYKGFQAISRGVVTPVGTNYIILFVTKEKQEALTQYNDYLDGDILHWEGEERHSSDKRIIDAKNNNDEIHLFYRDIHHSPFVYFWKIHLKKYIQHKDRPSEFVFHVGSTENTTDIFDDIQEHKYEFTSLDKTEQESIVKSRIGQGVFRERLISFWGGCAVTGLSNLSLLRASHIKPWRVCSNEERLDPMNGLLLHPMLDHLFDSGFITFQNNGMIQLSEFLSKDDIRILNINTKWHLLKVTEKLNAYMNYHREKVFKKG
jgi:hypothetical protein